MIHYFIYAGAALLIGRLFHRNTELKNRCGESTIKIIQLKQEANELRCALKDYEKHFRTRQHQTMSFNITNPHPDNANVHIPSRGAVKYNMPWLQKLMGVPDEFFSNDFLLLMGTIELTVTNQTHFIGSPLSEVVKRVSKEQIEILLTGYEQAKEFERYYTLYQHLNKQP